MALYHVEQTKGRHPGAHHETVEFENNPFRHDFRINSIWRYRNGQQPISNCD